MESLLLMSDGYIPIENNLIVGGRIKHRKHQSAVIRGGSALPKLMQNLQLFDTSQMVKKGGSIQTKPNHPLKKPIKFII